MNLATLAYDMRAAGIKSLALELADDSGSPPLVFSDERPTMAPGDIDPRNTERDPGNEVSDANRAEPKPPHQCLSPGCGQDNGGVMGKLKSLCRTHALAQMGIK